MPTMIMESHGGSRKQTRMTSLFLPNGHRFTKCISSGGVATPDASSLMSGKGLTAELKAEQTKPPETETNQLKVHKSRLQNKQKAHLAPREKQDR
jgi:hypothetical protein